MNGKNKKVLFVSYYYPSDTPGRYDRALRVGTERVLKFRKFLPEFGYDTCILTTRRWGSSPQDEERGIYRAPDPSSIFDKIRDLISAYFRSSNPKTVSETTKGATSVVKTSQAIVKWFREWVRQWVLIPDWGIVWLPFAVWAGYRLVRHEKVDVIVGTFRTPTNLLVGRCLSILTGVPLVLDFRDGWLFEPLESFLRYNRFRQAVDGMLERWVVNKSKAIVTVSDPLTAYFSQRYNLPENLALTITNGYDPDNWRDVNEAQKSNGRLRLVNTGAFGASRFSINIIPFLKGVTCVPASVRSLLEILLIGDLLPQEQEAINNLGLNDVIHVLPPVTREESLEFQLSADVLLLFAGMDKSVASSKLFEYLYARRPIFVLGHRETAASKIVQHTKAGIVVEPENSEQITSEIIHLFELWKTGGLSDYGKGDISMYHRRHLSGQLASLLDQIVTRCV
jgi:glycosyltransferase involved in cell wall biosynthesis